jgi:hypothetical protein
MKINIQSTNNPSTNNLTRNNASNRETRTTGNLGSNVGGGISSSSINSGSVNSGGVNLGSINSSNAHTNRQVSPQSSGLGALGNMLNPLGHLNYLAHTNPLRQLNPIDQINPLNKVTASKYSGEHHAISLDPRHFGEGYTFAGPGTALDTREKLHDNIPLNSLDNAAKEHDYAYMKEANDYSRDNNKTKHMENVWNADAQFMGKAFLNKDDPVMGTIAAGMIGAKMMGEKLGLLDTKRFSGIRETSSNQTTNVNSGVNPKTK